MTSLAAGVPLLEARGITKHFGGAFALSNASLTLRPGEVHALLGANGAGKSTLVKVIAGIYKQDAGDILIDGEVVDHRSLHDSQRAGIATMFQQLNVVEDLTVGEYLSLGRESTTFGLYRKRRAAAAARNALDQLGIDLDLRRPAGTLSVAERELVEIARAVSLDSRLVIMDEPTASLGGAEVERIFEVIRVLRNRNVAVLYVSHKLEEVLAVTDCSTVLRDGRNAGSIDTDRATQDDLLDMMVGNHQRHEPVVRAASEDVVLRLEDVSTTAGLSGIDLTLHRGEVLGVYGLMGAGRTELLHAIYGLDRITHGELSLGGKTVTLHSPAAAVRAGIGLVPEDRIREALIGDASVAGNITLTAARKLTRGGIYSSVRERNIARDAVDRLGIKVPGVSAPITTLSGGNQQKVVIGRWLISDARILLMDDPTVGVDVAAKEDIYRLIHQTTQAGTSVIVCSSELSELMRLADRVVIMHRRRIVQTVNTADGVVEELIRLSIVGSPPTTQLTETS